MIRFLRYPGGKGKLLLYLNKFFPKNVSTHGRYVEPFIGGGSVFLFLQPREAILSDLNQELIDLYKGIRNYPHKVWETFSSFPSGKEAYYQIRDTECAHKPMYYRAARTLYLNRTCFKGMWRHNPEGKFNVGYGGEERRWATEERPRGSRRTSERPRLPTSRTRWRRPPRVPSETRCPPCESSGGWRGA